MDKNDNNDGDFISEIVWFWVSLCNDLLSLLAGSNLLTRLEELNSASSSPFFLSDVRFPTPDIYMFLYFCQ